MSYQFNSLLDNETAIHALTNADEFRRLAQRMLDHDAPRLRRRWNYYRNLLTPVVARSDEAGSDRPYRQAQEWGLPARITGVMAGESASFAPLMDGVSRKEVVVENDIGWRIETLVDYLFGRPVTINSAAPDAKRREVIGKLLRAIFARHGGIVFLQQIALMGAVYGFVDVLVKFDAPAVKEISSESLIDLSTDSAGLSERAHPSSPDASVTPDAEPAPRADDSRKTNDEDAQDACLARLARCIRFEIVDPARALPLLDPNDYRNIQAYAQVYPIARPPNARSTASTAKKNWIEKLFPRFVTSALAMSATDSIDVVELITATRWQRYEDEVLVAEGNNSLAELPLVHIQNAAVPFEYVGSSDVESLIPLQDELNTRLSDRAHRITMQSFKMYLGKGIDNFGDLPVAPGRMWMTDNDNAQVIEFGGDASSPSEDSHIREIREAMDKTSSVTPIAAGAIKGRIGRLTSAAALRVTLLALLAKTDR
ncbi:MAG: phage portal protein, partial [Anaerolineae bacterium]|nr:phage portal protein [Phycisphaerae bacterium]